MHEPGTGREPGAVAPLRSQVDALGRAPLFAALPEASRHALAVHSRRRRYGPREVVFLEGDPSDALYVVVTGRLSVSVSSARGDELVLGTPGPGDTVGELGVLDGMSRSATVRTLTDAVLLRVDRAAILRLVADHPAAAEGFLRNMCDLARRLTGSSADLAFLDVPRRLARLLLDLADRADGRVADPGLTQSEVARRIASSRQAVNEALQRFARRGWVEVRGHEVVLLRPGELRDYVER